MSSRITAQSIEHRNQNQIVYLFRTTSAFNSYEKSGPCVFTEENLILCPWHSRNYRSKHGFGVVKGNLRGLKTNLCKSVEKALSCDESTSGSEMGLSFMHKPSV